MRTTGYAALSGLDYATIFICHASMALYPINAYHIAMAPLTNSQRVKQSNQALLARGGKRMPAGYLQPDTARMLSELVQSGYAQSPLAAIVAALHDAHKKIKRIG